MSIKLISLKPLLKQNEKAKLRQIELYYEADS